MPNNPPSPCGSTSVSFKIGIIAPVAGFSRLILPPLSVIQIKLSGPHKISQGKLKLLAMTLAFISTGPFGVWVYYCYSTFCKIATLLLTVIQERLKLFFS